ncbi:hypothetical protein ES707_21556 [subsurface metagenome]
MCVNHRQNSKILLTVQYVLQYHLHRSNPFVVVDRNTHTAEDSSEFQKLIYFAQPKQSSLGTNLISINL